MFFTSRDLFPFRFYATCFEQKAIDFGVGVVVPIRSNDAIRVLDGGQFVALFGHSGVGPTGVGDVVVFVDGTEPFVRENGGYLRTYKKGEE